MTNTTGWGQLVALILFLGCFFSGSVSVVHAEGSIRVMTYNMLYGNGWNPPQMAQYLKDEQIDIAVFQEVDCRELTAYREQLNTIEYPMYEYTTTHEPINYTYCGGDPDGLIPEEHGADGGSIGMLSRYPIINSDFMYFEHGERVVQTALIDAPSGRVRVFNGHMWRKGYDNDEFTTCPSVVLFMDWVRTFQDTGQKIVMGDFNVRFNEFGSAEAYKTLCGGQMVNYDMSCKEPDRCEISHKGFNAVVDFVFIPLESMLEFESSYVSHSLQISQLSDHLPVIAQIYNSQPAPSCSVSSNYSCSSDGSEVEIDWSVDANFSDRTVIVRMNNLESESWTPTILGQASNGSGDILFATTDPTTLSTTLPLLVGDRYVYRVDVYNSDQSIAQTPSICDNKVNNQDIPFQCPVPTLTPSVVDPDYDNDGEVGITDYSILISVFGTENCQYNLAKACEIDIFDFAVLVQAFNS